LKRTFSILIIIVEKEINMIGLIWIYFIGKPFFRLSEEYYKNKWLFAILGIASFYLGQLIAGAIMGFVSVLLDYHIEKLGDLLLGLMCLPFGLLASWGLYRLLKKRWENEQRPDEKAMNEAGIIDDGILDQ
jgi:hypothetical protein